MGMKERVRDLSEEATMEHALLLVFVGTAAYMFVGAFEFASAARHFPMLTTGIVIVLGLMLLFRQFLPGPLRRLVVDEVDVLETGADEFDTADEERAPEERAAEEQREAETIQNGAVVTGGLCVGYLVGAYLVGMLWVTPMFVFAYGRWRRLSTASTVGLTVLSFVVAFAFYWVIGLSIEEGLLHEVFL